MGSGFIAAAPQQGATEFHFTGLTWAGLEFLGSIRSPEVWSKTKAVMKAVGGFGLELMIQVAKEEGRRIIFEKLGLKI